MIMARLINVLGYTANRRGRRRTQVASAMSESAISESVRIE